MVSKISNMQRCSEYYRRRCRLRPATLRLHWGAVELVARALLAHGELSGPEVQRVLEHGNGFLPLEREKRVSRNSRRAAEGFPQRGLIDVRFASKATEVLRCREASLCCHKRL
jgi:hypothetical protein